MDKIAKLIALGHIKWGNEIKSPTNKKVHKELSPELQEELCRNYNKQVNNPDSPYYSIENAVMEPELFGPSDLHLYDKTTGYKLNTQELKKYYKGEKFS